MIFYAYRLVGSGTRPIHEIMSFVNRASGTLFGKAKGETYLMILLLSSRQAPDIPASKARRDGVRQQASAPPLPFSQESRGGAGQIISPASFLPKRNSLC
jgi:hypothetical protein